MKADVCARKRCSYKLEHDTLFSLVFRCILQSDKDYISGCLDLDDEDDDVGLVCDLICNGLTRGRLSCGSCGIDSDGSSSSDET